MCGGGIAFDRNENLENDVLFSEDIDLIIAPDTKPTQPYWLEEDPDGDLFRIPNEELLGKPMTPSALQATVRLMVDRSLIEVPITLSYKTTDPLEGDVIEELRIVPPVSVEPASRLAVRTPNGLTASIRLRAYAAVEGGTLVMRHSAGEQVLATNLSLRASTDTLITFTPDISSTQHVSFVVRVDGREYDRGVKIIDYGHLPTLQYLEPARMTIVPDKIEVTAKRVAFIPGAGEYAPTFLREMGVVVDEVTEDQILRTDDLLEYDAVLVGIRAVNINDNMKYIMPALMTYVERGGTLVMQYNTSRGLSTDELGPYPLKLSRDRVTEETAPVRMTWDPPHPLLSSPNRISPEDFNGWVQERGLYFPGEVDEAYDRLLEMADTDELPKSTSLLYAKYGKGHYVYCALSLFRQLPAGVPGGMKIMANLVSIGR